MARLFVLLAALLSPLAALAGPDAFFGLGLRTELDGTFWNPVLSSASIAEIAPNSPTAKGGLAVGDVVLTIEGLTVSGAKGDEFEKIKGILAKKPAIGDTLHLTLRRPNSQVYSAVLIAEPRP